MRLEADLTHQIGDPALTLSERIRLRCALAKELEEGGNYEAAHGALAERWRCVGERPHLEGLDELTAALVLLRAGTLTGWIGSSRQITGAQETAKDLIGEGEARFAALGDTMRAAEARIEIGECYRREGAFDEARITLREALSRLSDTEGELKAVALIRIADLERATNRLHESLRVLNEAAPLVQASGKHSLKGRFHNTLAVALKNLGASEGHQDCIDRALVEFAAAAFHFEQAGHTRFRARVENNLGFLLFRLGRFMEAHQHLDHARRLFVSLRDKGSVAQVDETRARLLLARGRNAEAERVARSAVHAQEKGGEQALLAESLTTHGTALARLGRSEQARSVLQRAVETAHLVGDHEKAGLAALTIIEELGDHLSRGEITAVYERADRLLADSRHLETLDRLRSCARRALRLGRARREDPGAPDFLYAAERTAALLRLARRMAGARNAVLITGEAGTGKGTLARQIHQWSGRGGAFVAVNCGAPADHPNRSQLVGRRRGSSAEETAGLPGAIRRAEGGTLFIDEVAGLSGPGQAQLLHLIEKGKVHRVDAEEEEGIDVRVIAATSRDLEQEMSEGRFREDLYYRLQPFQLGIPPLRERPDDIPVMAEHFIKEVLAERRKEVTFTPEAVGAMRKLKLRGNARELRSLIEGSVLLAGEGAAVTAEAVETVALRQTRGATFVGEWEGFSFHEEVLTYEGELIRRALSAAQGSVCRAARLLGISHQSLSYMLKKRHKNLVSAADLVNHRHRSVTRPS